MASRASVRIWRTEGSVSCASISAAIPMAISWERRRVSSSSPDGGVSAISACSRQRVQVAVRTFVWILISFMQVPPPGGAVI